MVRLGSRGRAALIAICVASAALGVLVMLWPVLVAPLAADQRYMYAEAPGQTAGHWGRMFSIPWDQIPLRLEQGRFAPVSFIGQFIAYTATTEVAIATSTPVVLVQAVQKILVLTAALGCVVAFVHQLRGRAADGRLVGLGRRALLMVGVAVAVLGAAGALAHLQPANGWITYAPITYGAVAVDFGIVALTLWLARRRVLAPSRGLTVLTAALLALVAVFLISSYELYYVSVPVALLALALQPLGPPELARRARRARLVVGGMLLGFFVAALVAVRVAIDNACSTGAACYTGTNAALGGELLPTWAYNLGSSLPLTSRAQVLEELRAVGLDRLPGAFGSPVAVFAVLAGAALVALRLLLGPISGGPPGASRGRAVACLHGALLAVCTALGSAALMSLSALSQQVINTTDHPYRHAVVTWVSLALAAVLALVALDLLVPRVRIAGWVVTGMVVALVGGIMLPLNLAATRAATVDRATLAVTRVYEQLVLGDPTPAGDQRRCTSVREARSALAGRGPAVIRMIYGADQEYRFRYGKPFCSSITPRPWRSPVEDEVR